MFIEYSMVRLIGLASLIFRMSVQGTLEQSVLSTTENGPETETYRTRGNILGHLIELVHVVQNTSFDVQVVFDLFVIGRHCADSMVELIRLASLIVKVFSYPQSILFFSFQLYGLM